MNTFEAALPYVKPARRSFMAQAVETVKGWTLASHTLIVLAVTFAVTLLAMYGKISSDATVGVYIAALGFARGANVETRKAINPND